jgi:hypothetical protein
MSDKFSHDVVRDMNLDSSIFSSYSKENIMIRVLVLV